MLAGKPRVHLHALPLPPMESSHPAPSSRPSLARTNPRLARVQLPAPARHVQFAFADDDAGQDDVEVRRPPCLNLLVDLVEQRLGPVSPKVGADNLILTGRLGLSATRRSTR